MSNITLATLPLDLCDRLLTFLSDYRSLRHTVLTTKRLYQAFSARKLSVTRAVELNEVGPALPFACALVRTKNRIGNDPIQTILAGLNDPNLDSAYWTTNVSAGEAKQLEANLAIVQRLESSFCMYFKDRAAPVSTLSELESYRFHRAIYRAWIISVLANDNNQESSPFGLDTRFLKNLCDEELLELHQAMLFLDHPFRSLIIRQSQFQGHGTNFTRPLQLPVDALMAQFDGRISPQAFGNALSRSGSAIVNGFYALRQERKLGDLLKQNDTHGILKDGRAEDVQRCQKCDTDTARLFGENNWHTLHEQFTSHDVISTLPGNLNRNGYVFIALSSIFAHHHSYATMMNEIFSSQNDPESGWRKDQWLCTTCIKNLMSERFYSWVVSSLVEDGFQFEENCWYGWNCRTQVHRMEHAKKLNHLCEPTRGDDSTNLNSSATESDDGETSDE